ncbi:MAG: hypothetical protein ACTSWN_06255 [Promethearchaeota archaeon]
MSGDDVPIIESQLSFSDTFLKNQYARIENLEVYRITQILDYGFMFGYGFTFFIISLHLKHKLQKDDNWLRFSVIMPYLAIVAPIFDAAENIFILLTLTDPTSFPGWWAIVHSTFATIKWLSLLVLATWAISTVIILVYRKHHR